MGEYDQLLETLIDELQTFLADRYVSEKSAERDGGYISIGPIEKDWPDLYKTVHSLEAAYGSQLPMGAWEHWNELLSISREVGNDARRVRTSSVVVNNLLSWAKNERQTHDALTQREGHSGGFLSLSLDTDARCVSRFQGTVDFEKSPVAWKLFAKLYKAGEHGCTRPDLMQDLYGDVARTPNVLDKHKSTVNEMIEKIGIEIVPNARGLWTIVRISPPTP